MRKAQKAQLLEILRTLREAHETIKKHINRCELETARALLGACQQSALQVGAIIEESEGEDCPTVRMLEKYCEELYQVNIGIPSAVSAKKAHKLLNNALFQAEHSVDVDIPVRREIVFLPYKVSMFDSFESVWRAADADPDCDAYVVPIPYYDKNPDGSLKTRHYEGALYPEDVPVVQYESYDFEKRRPDAIFIHSPYDDMNRVTTVDPQFYSHELKKYTELLIYVPYYITAGNMSEGQDLCPAYLHADYIVTQSQRLNAFFHPAVPKSKLLPLGSPKLDRVISACKNPPEPPENWKARLAGRKVYFYNTSIGGLLENTKIFLEKMAYVFRCFEGRTDACLFWRPHPLLESTLESMRPHYKPLYQELKRRFLSSGTGIYDDTPDVTRAIALSDAYIGDCASSIVALFGFAGKPLFILNNALTSAPGLDDWRGQVITGIFGVDIYDGTDYSKWMLTQGNQLYHAPEGSYKYRHCCSLSDYAYGNYYSGLAEINGKMYACPINAQDILVIENGQIERRIPLKHAVDQPGAFLASWFIGKYLFLIPNKYPALVRYDTERDKVEYWKGYHDFFIRQVESEWRIGPSGIWNEKILFASPEDNQVLSIDGSTGRTELLTVGTENFGGCMGMCPDGREIWLLPFSGTSIIRWNPETGESQTYCDMPAGFQCINRPHGYACMNRPFGSIAFCQDEVFVAPCWGNMFLRINKKSGEIQEWKPPFPVRYTAENGYFASWSLGNFLVRAISEERWTYQFFSLPDSKLYNIDLETGEYSEVPITFDLDELRAHEPGFCEESEWLQYCCRENCFNSLEQFLDGRVVGSPFDRERQLRAYRRIAANSDGTCGEKLYEFVRKKLTAEKRGR